MEQVKSQEAIEHRGAKREGSLVGKDGCILRAAEDLVGVRSQGVHVFSAC